MGMTIKERTNVFCCMEMTRLSEMLSSVTREAEKEGAKVQLSLGKNPGWYPIFSLVNYVHNKDCGGIAFKLKTCPFCGKEYGDAMGDGK